MLSIDVWSVYFVTVLAFMITPGPSHLLMLSNSMAHGLPRASATAVGDLTANAIQMLIAGLGLASLIVASGNALTVIKLCGALYLGWMGLRLWWQAGRSSDTSRVSGGSSVRRLWLQGFLTSAANPKAIVFFAALFPQFIDPSKPFVGQYLVLASTYIVIDGVFLLGYGASAHWLASRLRGQARKWIDYLGGTFLLGAALLLGLKTLKESD